MSIETLSSGVLFKLNISIWTGAATLEPPDLGLDPGAIAAHYTLGRKRLVPKEALDPIRQVANRTQYRFEHLSHEVLPDGSRFVLSHTVPEALELLEREKEAFASTANAFLEAYPQWQEAMRTEWERAAKSAWVTAGRPEDETSFTAAFLARVAEAYPPIAKLRRKFDFFWYTYELKLSGLTEIDAASVAAEENRRREQDAAYRDQVEQRINEALNRSINGYRQRVAEAFQAVLDHIRSGKAVRQGSVVRLRKTIDAFRKINIFENDDLEAELRQFERQCLEGLDLQAGPIADPDRVFEQGLAQVVAAATAPGDLSALTGKRRRHLELTPATELVNA